ncbi:flagellar hook capping FlgD N-terminal domain-containing protein [Cochlodiniinecator piscidefendens]|uniref:flagellar hook capping FlgD N-terminal domain-containing protein n=1 Tax=Cochlodiniinecator piscidefendens TaxID=2715756 RepID=UPI00140DF529|nr:flagellar hook capping FlgD N-terminal domain-containing protein [Cochlodiniinecator piscidefendens]
MEVNSSQSAQQTQSASTSASAAITSDFDTFLKMMTAQIQNQDPLSPMSSEEFAVQLATFSGVEQQVRTNDLLVGLGAQMGIQNMAQMASWVGMEARVAAPAHFDGQPITISPNPAAQSNSAVLVVTDSDGEEVQRIDIPATAEPVEWAGVHEDGTPFETGTYSFAVESYQDGTIMTTTTAEIYAEITEVSGGGVGGATLILDSGVRISTDNVTALRQGNSS